MDLLESGSEREPRALLTARLPGWAIAAVVAGVALVLVGGLLTAIDLRREAARPDVAVQVRDGSFSTVGGVARGTLELRLINRGHEPVQVELGFEVEGLRVTGASPEPIGVLPVGVERDLRVAYVVPDCARLVLPGRVLVRAWTDDQEVQRELPVVDSRNGRPAPEALPLGACPPSSRSAVPGEPTDLGARPAGGQVRRLGAGAEGTARLEVRNGGPAVRLLSVDARVPGAVFTPRVLDGGLTLETDGLAIVTLRFSVPDCARLEQTGALVLQVERFGGVQELRLPVSAGLAGSSGPRVDLRVVLDSCG